MCIWHARHTPTAGAARQASVNLPPGCRTALLEEVLLAGQAAPQRLPMALPHHRAALVKLLYTSGSTGLPKGAMNTDSIWRQACAPVALLRYSGWCAMFFRDPDMAQPSTLVTGGWEVYRGKYMFSVHGGKDLWCVVVCCMNWPATTWVVCLQMLLTSFEDAEDELPAISLHYLPLNHIAGHISLLKALCRGGITYFTRSSDMSTFFEVPSLPEMKQSRVASNRHSAEMKTWKSGFGHPLHETGVPTQTLREQGDTRIKVCGLMIGLLRK